MTEPTQQVSFQFANECDLEIHCSPFGLSGLYIKVKGTNIMGIGSTMGLVTGSTTGLIHYNDCKDLMDQKYKVYVIVDDDGNLRIDFTKIFTLKNSNGNASSANNGNSNPESDNKSAGILSPENSTSASGFSAGLSEKSPDEQQSNSFTPSGSSPEIKREGSLDLDSYEEDEFPTLVFQGICPEGRPDKVDPFIGIFSFERED